MRAENGENEKNKSGLSFFLGFIKNMASSIFRKEDGAESSRKLPTGSLDEDGGNLPCLFENTARNEYGKPFAELTKILEGLRSIDSMRILADYISLHERGITGDAGISLIEAELERFRRGCDDYSIAIISGLSESRAGEVVRFCDRILSDPGIPINIAAAVARAGSARIAAISPSSGGELDAKAREYKNTLSRLLWLEASEKRIVEYIVSGLARFTGPSGRFSCITKIKPYVISRAKDELLKEKTESLLTQWLRYYSSLEEEETIGDEVQVEREASESGDEELPEFGEEEEELLARLGRTEESPEDETGEGPVIETEDGTGVPEEDEAGLEVYDDGISQRNFELNEPGDYGDEAPSSIDLSEYVAEPAEIAATPRQRELLKKLETEIDSIPSVDERIVTIAFWMENHYFGEEPLFTDFLATKLETLNALRARSGGLIADLFYSLRKIEDKESQLEFLNSRLRAPELAHVRQTIATIIGNLEADIDFSSPSITEETVSEMLDVEADPEKKLALLYSMKYDEKLSRLEEFIEERIEELEKLSSDKTWENLEEMHYDRIMEEAKTRRSGPTGTIALHNNVITLVRALKNIPDKVERKKLIKEQEALKPLPDSDTFQKQRKLLYYFMSADSMDKPDAMLKALADRVLLSFKEKKEYIEVLKKARFSSGGRILTLAEELGITSEQIAYSAVYIIGSDVAFLEKRIKHIELFREGSLPLPQVAYMSAAGAEMKAGYRDFFAITCREIDAVLDYFRKFVEGRKAIARQHLGEERERRSRPQALDASLSRVKRNIKAKTELGGGVARTANENEKAESAYITDTFAEANETASEEAETIEGQPREEAFEVALEEGTDMEVEIGGSEENPAFNPDDAAEIDLDSLLLPDARISSGSGHAKIEPLDQSSVNQPKESTGKRKEPAHGKESPEDEAVDSTRADESILTDSRYTEHRASVDKVIRSQILANGVAKSKEESASVKAETQKKIEEKVPTAEQKAGALLARLSLCFPEAVPELITSAIIPIFVAKEEYILRDLFTALNQNIFIPVLYEGAAVDAREAIAALASFLNLSSLGRECEKTALSIVARLKKVRASFIKKQVAGKAGMTQDTADTTDPLESICHVLLGLDPKQDVIRYLDEKYISVVGEKPQDAPYKIKLTNMKSILASVKSINWEKVRGYFGGTVSNLIAQIKRRLGSPDGFVFSMDDKAKTTGQRDSGLKGLTEEESEIDKSQGKEKPEEKPKESAFSGEKQIEKKGDQSKTEQKEAGPEETALGKTSSSSGKQPGGLHPEKSGQRNPIQTKMGDKPKTVAQGIQKKPQKQSFLSVFSQKPGEVKKKKPPAAITSGSGIERKHKPKTALKSKTITGKAQSTLLENAKQLVTEKLLYLIKEYSNLAMLDMLSKSYLSPKSPKKNLLLLINPKKHKVIYDAIEGDEYTIEKLSFDKARVFAAFEKKKRKLL